MNLFLKIKLRLQREEFQPTLLGIIVNPVFIIRNSLYKSVKLFASEIGGNVLDFGCGSKPYEDLFVNCREYVGCDIKVSGHNHKDSKIDYFLEGDVLPFEDEEFDAVVSFEVFEHLFNLPDVLKEINRVTKPTGYLLVSVPFVWAEHEAPYDFARYTNFGMTNILETHGYHILELKKTTSTILTISQLRIAYLIQHVLPKNRFFYFFQVTLIFPLTVFSYLIDAIFPQRYDLFCNLVILAKKSDVS